MKCNEQDEKDGKSIWQKSLKIVASPGLDSSMCNVHWNY